MEGENATKALKDKCCPYCGQAFTSSSLGRHLDLYIKEKNPKAPDGLHNVDEIRKLRGSITRRQPRGGARRDGSAPRDSQTGSKRSSGASDADSIMTRSPGDGSAGTDTRCSRSNPQRVFNRQIMKSSLEVKQRVQDAIDTAKAAELALREVMSSWKASRLQVEARSMPFDFDPLSLDFPALCLQCLESPPTLFSSTPHSTATSWSIMPPGDKQNEALKIYFQEEFRKWKVICSTATTIPVDELSHLPPQPVTQQDNAHLAAQKAVESAKKLEGQVAEHLEESFQVWEQLPIQRRQELWVLEMARNIGKRQKEVLKLKEARLSLKQENTNLKSQVDNLKRQKQPKDFKILTSLPLRMDDKMSALWSETGIGGRQSIDINYEDRQDLNTIVSGAIERWKNVIVTSRAANTVNAQRSLDEVSASLKTPTSTEQPLSPEESRPTQQRQYHGGGHSRFHPLSSPNAQSGSGRNASTSTADPTATTVSEPKTSANSTPTQSTDDSDEDADADGDEDADADADADADVEMELGLEGGSEYLSATNTPTRHTAPHLPLHSAPQHHQVNPVIRAHDQHISAVRHNPYSQRESPYGHHGVLPSHPIHMSQQAFGHQLQSLEHHLAQGHGMEWNNNH